MQDTKEEGEKTLAVQPSAADINAAIQDTMEEKGDADQKREGPKVMNAFDLINKCGGMALNRMFQTTEENAARNNCTRIRVRLGDAGLLSSEKKYDLIIANINRNILINDMPVYVSCLKKGGILLLSGFYSEDLKMISECCVKNGLQFVENKERNNWIAAKFVH